MGENILAKANNKFGLNLFKVTHKDLKGKNAFLSPFSISAALSMTQIGAREKTAKEMAQVLGWESENGEKIHQQFQAYLRTLQQPSDQYQLSIANRIFLEKSYTVVDDFKNKTKEWYLAGGCPVMFCI
jgi:serpin B